MHPVIVIPAYKPETILLELVAKLCEDPTQHVIIVNDGSGDDFNEIFASCNKHNQVAVLEHAINMGKGQALKTAFNYYLTHFGCDNPGVITADADGQHLITDIFRLRDKLASTPHGLWLGSREFQSEVPWKSKFGNVLTRGIFKVLIGESLTDTQTGLRAIPRYFLGLLLNSSSQGYDFELDMLIMAHKLKIKINEVPIKTVYKDNNKSSHFNPLVDSFKIYFVFFRFLIFAVISGALDFLAFSLAYMVFGHILFSETLARIFSGSCNFIFNKGLVFKSKQRVLPEAIKYTLLCLANLVISYALISSLVFIGLNVYFSKIIALAGLFVANFAIQKLLVFSKEEQPNLWAANKGN